VLPKIQNLVSTHKITLGLLFIAVLLIGGGFTVYQRFAGSQNQTPGEEVDLVFDAEGPYALLEPRRDGNALTLNLKRTSSYDSISYELAYTSNVDESVVEGSKIKDEDSGSEVGSIDRGVVGNIDTKQKRGEYQQEILFGTCSKNVCKYDKGVENGTLTLHITKGKQAFRMITQWHLQQPDVSLGVITSGDSHLIYKTEAKREELNTTGFVITNDVTGVPKLPDGKAVSGKVYALNTPTAKTLPSGTVTIEMAENPSSELKIARYDGAANKWIEMETKIEGSKLTASANGAGIFAVLISGK